MATVDSPPSGTFPITFAPSLFGPEASGSRKRKAPAELVSFRYAFKPGSILPTTPGSLKSEGSKAHVLAFDTDSSSQLVFDGREEVSKSRECALVWNEDTETYTLYPVSSTLQLSVNRLLSGRPRPASTEPNAMEVEDEDADGEPEYIETEPISIPKPLKERPAERKHSVSPVRPSRGGKSLPRKAPKADTKKPSRTPAKKASKSAGKYKSAETIEDSDEDEDEFAKLLGESIAADAAHGEDDEDEDDDDDEDEDEERELGGVRLVVRENPGVRSLADTLGLQDESSEDESD